MKFIVDQCAGRRIAQWLQREEHDVREVRTMVPDPGDPAILDLANLEGRVIITRDKDFGKLVHRDRQPHTGIIQIPNVSVERRIEMVRQVLEQHRNDLRDGAMIAVDWGGRIRVDNQAEQEEPRGRFGQEIRAAREALGIRQHELAERLGISAQYLSDVERGRRRPLRNRLVRRLARELRMPADVLWFRAGRIPPEILHEDPPPEAIVAAMAAFRKELRMRMDEERRSMSNINGKAEAAYETMAEAADGKIPWWEDLSGEERERLIQACGQAVQDDPHADLIDVLHAEAQRAAEGK